MKHNYYPEVFINNRMAFSISIPGDKSTGLRWIEQLQESLHIYARVTISDFSVTIYNENREILIIDTDYTNPEDLTNEISHREHASIILISRNKTIRKEIGWILSKYDIPLITVPQPQFGNDIANYMQLKINPDFHDKIMYDLGVNIVGGLIVYLLTQAI